MTISEIDEGNEWIAKLEAEAMALTIDIMQLEDTKQISHHGITALRFALQRTLETIEELKLEVLFLDSDTDF